MINVLRASIKAAAVGGIFFALASHAIEAFKMAWHIISTSQEDEAKQRVMCEECNGYFLDDGDELIHGKLLCESCSDDLVCDQLKN